MNSLKSQQGFVHSRVMDLVFLFVMILAGWGLVKVFETLISGDYAVAFFVTWLLASAAAWWWCRDQRLLLRVPTGLLMFITLGSVLIPLSWWTQSRLAAGTEAAVAAVLARYLGGRCSRLIEARIAAGTPWYLDQRIDLVADLGRWVAASIFAWFLAVVPPMTLVFVIPPEWVPWAALVWAFAAVTFYIYKHRPARWRLFKLPLALYAFVITSAVLLIFQKQVVGPMEAGSFEQIAYVAFWPAIAGLFVEFAAVGTPSKQG